MKQNLPVATSAVSPKKPKRKRKNGVKTATAAPVMPKLTRPSKKVLKKLLARKIAYKPFSEFKESRGVEGDYRKLIYNTPKY